MVDIQCVWEESAILGEGPLWAAGENAIYWVDIVGKKVHGLTDIWFAHGEGVDLS